VDAIETPTPFYTSTGGELYNPECHEYERYLLENQIELVEKLRIGEIKLDWRAIFDGNYGHITKLIVGTGGESVRVVNYSNFRPK
jgi:hypothetical protein